MQGDPILPGPEIKPRPLAKFRPYSLILRYAGDQL